MAQCGLMWSSVVQCGLQRFNVVHCGLRWVFFFFLPFCQAWSQIFVIFFSSYRLFLFRIKALLGYLKIFSGEVIYVAQHNFKGTSDSDLPFKKGEKLRVLQEWVTTAHPQNCSSSWAAANGLLCEIIMWSVVLSLEMESGGWPGRWWLGRKASYPPTTWPGPTLWRWRSEGPPQEIRELLGVMTGHWQTRCHLQVVYKRY